MFVHVPDPRFPEDGKVELLLSDSPEKIRGRFTLTKDDFVFCRFFENDIVTQTKGTRQHDYSELDNKPENKYAGENVFQMFHRFCQALLRDPQCIGSSFPTAFII